MTREPTYEPDSRTSRSYEVACELSYVVEEPSTFILNIAPAGVTSQRVVTETISVVPEIKIDEFTEGTTGTRYHRFRLATDTTLTVRFNAEVVRSPRLCEPGRIALSAPDNIPLAILPYLYPSRYCQSDLLDRLAQREFGRINGGYDQVVAICAWLRRNVDYLYGTTGSLTSAYDTAVARAGVCRDYTHLAIAFCRALNIPARFVSGYVEGLEPPDFHAVFETWLGGRWYMFDPTGLTSPENLVRIGTGRDAADVAFAFIFGPATMTTMWVYCRRIGPNGSLTARQAKLAVCGD